MKSICLMGIVCAIFFAGCGEYKPPESDLDKLPLPKPYVEDKAWYGSEKAIQQVKEANRILFSGANKEDFKKAYMLLTSAAKDGSLDAVTSMASLNRTGYSSHLKKDPEKAFKYFKIAAEKGFPPAQHDLGRRYALGEGTQKDLKEALKWFQKAADQGLVLGYTQVAQAYEHGEGAKVDMKKAITYYYYAASANMPFAQYNLSILIGRGIGFPLSKIDSHKWALIAASNGYENAKGLVSRQQPLLEKEEREYAEKLANEWLAKNRKK